MGVMMRIVTAALLAALVGLLLHGAVAQAQTAPSGVRTAQAGPTDTLGATAPPRSGACRSIRVKKWRPPSIRNTIRAERGARLHRDLCAGIPAERHGDHAAHELLLAAGLRHSNCSAGRSGSSPRRGRCAMATQAAPQRCDRVRRCTATSEAATGSRDSHSSRWSSYSVRIQFAAAVWRSALWQAAESIAQGRRDPMIPRKD